MPTKWHTAQAPPEWRRPIADRIVADGRERAGGCTVEAVGRVSEEQRRCFLVVKVHLFELVPLAGGILSLVQIVQVLVPQPLRQLYVAQLPVFELESQPHRHLAATEPSACSQSTGPETRKQAGPLQQGAALHVAPSARARTHRHARAKSVLALRERNLDRHLGLEGAEAAGEEMDLLEREVRRDFHQLILCHRHNSARTASGHTVTRGMRAALLDMGSGNAGLASRGVRALKRRAQLTREHLELSSRESFKWLARLDAVCCHRVLPLQPPHAFRTASARGEWPKPRLPRANQS